MLQSIVSLSEFKAKAAQMLAEIQAAEHTIIVTQRGRASAVVQNVESYQRMQNALLMLKLMVEGEADASQGRETTQDRVFADERARLMADG